MNEDQFLRSERKCLPRNRGANTTSAFALKWRGTCMDAGKTGSVYFLAISIGTKNPPLRSTARIAYKTWLLHSVPLRGGSAHLRGPTAFGRKNVPCVVRRHQGTYFAEAEGREFLFFGRNYIAQKPAPTALSEWGLVFSCRVCPTYAYNVPHVLCKRRQALDEGQCMVFFAQGAFPWEYALPF